MNSKAVGIFLSLSLCTTLVACGDGGSNSNVSPTASPVEKATPSPSVADIPSPSVTPSLAVTPEAIPDASASVSPQVPTGITSGDDQPRSGGSRSNNSISEVPARKRQGSRKRRPAKRSEEKGMAERAGEGKTPTAKRKTRQPKTNEIPGPLDNPADFPKPNKNRRSKKSAAGSTNSKKREVTREDESSTPDVSPRSSVQPGGEEGNAAPNKQPKQTSKEQAAPNNSNSGQEIEN
jgi:hypothetical protein